MARGLSVLSDAPSGSASDRLQFSRYVEPLTEVIMNDATQTPFTVGIFGAWGSGKSSLLEMIDQKLASHHDQEVVRVHFNPWIYRREPNILIPLLHTLQDTLAGDGRSRFAESARTIGCIAAKLSAGVLLSKLSGGAVSLASLDDLMEKYSQQRHETESEMSRLRDTLQQQAATIQGKGARVVFFIDDLDRCEPDEIIDLLESIKLFLDLRNVFIIIAIAKDVVDRGVAFKYRDFGFTEDKVLTVGDEYLDKMIQLPLYLLPIDSGAVGEFMRGFDLPEDVRAQIGLLQDIVSPNPRRIKRVLNTCAITYAIIQRSPGLEDLSLDLIARLAVLRLQSPDLYAAVIRNPDLLAALEMTCRGKRQDSFDRAFGSGHGESMMNAAAEFRGKQEYLEKVFGDSTFGQVRNDLQRYLTMLSGA
ncbi:MAG: P-loop NTPase fold protein [Streptosporangiaceae bacterium]